MNFKLDTVNLEVLKRSLKTSTSPHYFKESYWCEVCGGGGTVFCSFVLKGILQIKGRNNF
jgi:hypothetical protein